MRSIPHDTNTLGEQFAVAIRSHGMRGTFPGNRFPSDNCPKITAKSGLNPDWHWKPRKPFIERGTGRALPRLADYGSKAAAPLEIEKAKRDARTAPTVFWPRWADDGLRPWERARPRAKAPDKEPAPKATITYLPRYSLQLPCYKAAA